MRNNCIECGHDATHPGYLKAHKRSSMEIQKSLFVGTKRINIVTAERVTSWMMKQSNCEITLSSIIMNVHVVGNSFQLVQWWNGILCMSIIHSFEENKGFLHISWKYALLWIQLNHTISELSTHASETVKYHI